MKNTFALFSNDRKLLLWGIVVLVAVLIAVMVCPSVECFFMSLTGIKTKPELIKLMGWGMSGVIAIFGVMGLLQRAAALDKQNEMTEKGHIHERFKAAIEHLGRMRVSVRISSFYEFYRLAEIESDLKEPIFDILCAHLRKSTEDLNYKNKDEHKKIEMQILLDILFKEYKDKLIFDGLVANLEGADLSGVNLQNAKLQKANLQGACLQKAFLHKADLQHAKLQGAKLQGAVLMAAELQMAGLWDTKLQGANLIEANLQGADLQGVFMQEPDMEGADLTGVRINKQTKITVPDGWEKEVEPGKNNSWLLNRVNR